ncbi:MAG TPA: hypothetical protein DIU23_04550 [Candidatus Pacebacteria bacterium]|nr:hypothetical protein [Candidatus Paceibacterota bacterium]
MSPVQAGIPVPTILQNKLQNAISLCVQMDANSIRMTLMVLKPGDVALLLLVYKSRNFPELLVFLLLLMDSAVKST